VSPEDIFIPHGQGCEARVFFPDDSAHCGAPAVRHVVTEVGSEKYVCRDHGRELPDAGW
jgi:hypothetical protein